MSLLSRTYFMSFSIYDENRTLLEKRWRVSRRFRWQGDGAGVLIEYMNKLVDEFPGRILVLDKFERVE